MDRKDWLSLGRRLRGARHNASAVHKGAPTALTWNCVVFVANGEPPMFAIGLASFDDAVAELREIGKAVEEFTGVAIWSQKKPIQERN